MQSPYACDIQTHRKNRNQYRAADFPHERMADPLGGGDQQPEDSCQQEQIADSPKENRPGLVGDIPKVIEPLVVQLVPHAEHVQICEAQSRADARPQGPCRPTLRPTDTLWFWSYGKDRTRSIG